MKAQELRIGNLLMFNDKPIAINAGFIHDLDYSLKNPEREDANCFTDLSPIELTEEWMIKFGFMCKRPNNFTLEFGIKIKPWNYLSLEESTTKWYCDINYTYKDEHSCITLPDVKYVHQLQNLYFALTGKELTL